MTASRAGLAMAALWLTLALPHAGTRYSYDWDSSQFERGVRHFDIASHQPHPPGYPLWILALRILSPVTGRVNSAQVMLAMAFTIGGLLFFRSLAREELGERAGDGATAVLAFSPLVLVYAITPAVYAVDLFASCATGWFARRLWRGESRVAPAALAVAAIAAGFRPSGMTFLLPLLAVALWRAQRTNAPHVAAGIACGAALWLAWMVPTAVLSGGFRALSALDRQQLASSVRSTSVFWGAPASVHAHMAMDVCLYFALALAAFAVLLSSRWSRLPRGLFYVLWLTPNLAFIYLLHCGKPGYVLLSLPPMVLLGGALGRRACEQPARMAAAVALSLMAGYFPYEYFVRPGPPKLTYQLLRASPRMPGLLEDAQRKLREQIDGLPGLPEQKLVYCFLDRAEAPNIRTVTEEYADVYWETGEGPALRVYAPRGGEVSGRVPGGIRSVAWLCDGAGLPAAIRGKYPGARQVMGNSLYSFWTMN